MTDPLSPCEPNGPQLTADHAAVRRRKAGGVFQAVLGAFLLLLMGTILWRMAPMLLSAPAPSVGGSRFNASPDAARMVLGLFGSVMLFGGVSLAIGVRQAATGERSRRLRYLLWAAGALQTAFGSDASTPMAPPAAKIQR